MLDMIALILAIVGGLNWGLIGLFQFDIVAALFGGATHLISRIIYSLVGVAGIYSISLLFHFSFGTYSWILPVCVFLD